jgi:hypothetical protein
VANIARVIGIDPKTLRRHYRDELDTGAVKATARVAEFLYRKATTEGLQCVTAAIFWLKTRGRWKEDAGPPPPATGPVIYEFRWQTGTDDDMEMPKTIPGQRLIEG